MAPVIAGNNGTEKTAIISTSSQPHFEKRKSSVRQLNVSYFKYV
jgi:hypothetical protein